MTSQRKQVETIDLRQSKLAIESPFRRLIGDGFEVKQIIPEPAALAVLVKDPEEDDADCRTYSYRIRRNPRRRYRGDTESAIERMIESFEKVADRLLTPSTPSPLAGFEAPPQNFGAEFRPSADLRRCDRETAREVARRIRQWYGIAETAATSVDNIEPGSAPFDVEWIAQAIAAERDRVHEYIAKGE